ncbi:hypothetical protein [Streptomyces sp. NPDC057740]|uniref:hypothetical protein n=1 Tax=Streptomyces sp. NPDC057740 TaxID=3346234 RepID=UPI0036BF58FE
MRCRRHARRRPRQRGALRNGTADQPSAQWIAASAADHRYADRPDDHTIDPGIRLEGFVDTPDRRLTDAAYQAPAS